MNTFSEADRIEVVVHRIPEPQPKTPQWLLDLASQGPVQSPLPIQYTFSEPKRQHALIQWLLTFLKIR